MKIPFSPPYVDDDVLNEVQDTLKSGWITTGPKVKALEIETAQLASVSYALCVNSATSGLMLAMRWFGIGPGDEVIVPAYTYCATALAVIHLGATPIMVDIQDDFTLDVKDVEKKISSKTKAIIPVDIAGWPADYDALNQLVKREDILAMFDAQNDIQRVLGRLLILSDAAHSLGAIYKGLPTGRLADLTVFSFHAVKNITTAEGGCIAINLPNNFDHLDVYSVMRLMTLNGQTKDAFTKTKNGGWKYDIILAGFKMNMPDVCAAIGLAQIRKYNSIILPQRKKVANFYTQLFSKYNWAKLPMLLTNGIESSYHIFPLRIIGINENIRDAIIEDISRKGVAVNVHFIPMPMLTLFKSMSYDINDYPISYLNYSCEISLPIYPQLTIKQVEFIVNSIVESYEKIRKLEIKI
ncbi:MAG: DegT/DnrJ/EryC1/StrS family aminotransferase [Bacteroidales bacterium]|nr:MAG: DegT/DnrJ/EryC1/StrS family aminotransferase [Bacteroidales bacterium]